MRSVPLTVTQPPHLSPLAASSCPFAVERLAQTFHIVLGIM